MFFAKPIVWTEEKKSMSHYINDLISEEEEQKDILDELPMKVQNSLAKHGLLDLEDQ